MDFTMCFQYLDNYSTFILVANARRLSSNVMVDMFKTPL